MSNSHTRAVMFLVLASVLWSTGGVLIKLVNLNAVAIASLRSGIAAITIGMYMRKFKVKVTREKLIGGIAYTTTVILFCMATKMTTAANAILLQYTAPVFVAILSGWILKEKVSGIDWGAICCVMFGMVLFFIGDIEAGQMMGNLLAIGAGVSLACVVICLKVQKDSPVEMTYVGNIMTFIVGLPFAVQTVPDANSMLGLLLLGVFQLGTAYILFAEASRHLNAIEAILIPVVEPLLNPIWVLMFTGEYPGVFALLGGLVVISAVLVRGLIIQRLNHRAVAVRKSMV